MKRRIFLTGLAAAALPLNAIAQTRAPLTLMGPETPQAMARLHEALTSQVAMNGLSFAYTQARPTQIVSQLAAQADASSLPDLVILPTPDLAVRLANEGFALPQEQQLGRDVPHWRYEVFAVGYDAAVFVTRKGRIPAQDLPRSRIELARMLEQNKSRFQARVGLVNVGIDNVAYGYAAQDSLRSALFWRISGAFGASQARIFDTADELLTALSEGAIDFGYNVPLTAVRRFMQSDPELEIIIPQDYVLALPWCALVPVNVARHAARPQPNELVSLLVSNTARAALDELGLIALDATKSVENLQTIDLGPELLVFLDPLKRSRFLDTWFQLVVQN
jgi:iron(III) transport system substrate-binding protein